MTQARRIARNRRREMALASVGVSEFEVACRGELDHERRDVRMRILDKVRDFAAHVHEPDLDKAWAYLQESRRDYVPGRDGLSELMVAVDTWGTLETVECGCCKRRVDRLDGLYGACNRCAHCQSIGHCYEGEDLPENTECCHGRKCFKE